MEAKGGWSDKAHSAYARIRGSSLSLVGVRRFDLAHIRIFASTAG